MPTNAEDVCLSGKTGSDRRVLRMTRLTHNGPGRLPEHALTRIAKGDGLFLKSVTEQAYRSLACITFNGAIVPVDGGFSPGMISHSVPARRRIVPALRLPVRRTPGLRCFAPAPLRLRRLGSY